MNLAPEKHPYAFSAGFALVLSFSMVGFAGELRGKVVTTGGEPLEGARVRVQATDNFSLTDATGNFVLHGIEEEGEIVVTAWKHGYYCLGVEAARGDEDIKLTLEIYPATDNPLYEWLPPGGENGCAACHSSAIVPQWEANLHSQAAVNPFVLSMYSGIDVNGNPEPLLSYRNDFPGTPGNCACCHAPGAAVNQPYGVFLDEVPGVDAQGVHCDFCHKIFETAIPKPGMPGVLSITLRRPAAGGRNMFFGPFDDVAEGDDSFLPLQGKSRFCAPCHHHSSWGTPIYPSYQEWFESPYRLQGVECQHCHNTPDGTLSNIAPGNAAAAARDPARVPSHNMMGTDRNAFIASAITMEVHVGIEGGLLVASVRIVNSGGGHHFPTGQPMRNVLLVVEAWSGDGESITLLEGPLLPVHAGDFAGKPGRFYAKILEEIGTRYPDRPSRPIRIPAPQWTQTRIGSDTRIPALGVDESQYAFNCAPGQNIRLEVRLIYRRAFYAFAQLKGWDNPDNVLKRYDRVIVQE